MRAGLISSFSPDLSIAMRELEFPVALALIGLELGPQETQAIANNLPQLTSLDLRGNSIGDEGAVAIANNLPQLTSLDLRFNSIGDEGAVAIANNLPQLTSLDLRGNSIGHEGAVAIARNLPQLTSLYLGFNTIGHEGAVAIARNLPQLTSLDLENNSIGHEGAVAIARNLPQLTSLNLGFNTIGHEGAVAIARNLPQLTSLDLENNSIGDEGAEAIANNLPQLTSLDLENNSIGHEGAESVLEAFQNRGLRTLWLSKNPCVDQFLTPEVFESSDAAALLAAWRDYRDAAATGRLERLNEAKLIIVGNEAVGKTSLIRFLLDNKPCDPDEQKTPGVQQHERIETDNWHPEGSEVRLNVWDFGGQEIMHGTHRYFLTNRSLYLLILEDRREDDPPVQPWMRIIESLAGDSPVLVVINKSDEGKQALQLDEAGLHRIFPQIVGFYRTSCSGGDWSERSIGELRKTIVGILNDDDRLAHIRNPIPASWLAVKNEVGRRSRQSAFLDIKTFHSICVDPEIIGTDAISGADSQRALLRQLHELGVIVAHGLERDAPAALGTVTLLDPNWLTDAIYSVLNSAKLQETGGEFSDADLIAWLDPSIYPVDRHEFIVSMMRNKEIGLCFRLPGDEKRFLAPEALPRKSPDFTGWSDGALRFRYRYSHLPVALIPRLIVRLHDSLTEPRTVWRTGARFRIRRAEILVEANRDERLIDVSIKGADCREALSIARHAMEQLHESFADLDVEEWVPMPDNPEVEERFQYLVELERDEGPEYEHRPSGAQRRYRVAELLETVSERAAAQQSKRDGDAAPVAAAVQSSDLAPNRLSAILSRALLIPAGAALIGSVLSFFEFGLGAIWSLAIGFGVFVVVSLVLRMFDRGFIFRRLFAAWSFAGLSLLGISGFAIAFQSKALSASFGGTPPWQVAISWLIALALFGGLAWWEAKDSGRA